MQDTCRIQKPVAAADRDLAARRKVLPGFPILPGRSTIFASCQVRSSIDTARRFKQNWLLIIINTVPIPPGIDRSLPVLFPRSNPPCVSHWLAPAGMLQVSPERYFLMFGSDRDAHGQHLDINTFWIRLNPFCFSVPGRTAWQIQW